VAAVDLKNIVSDQIKIQASANNIPGGAAGATGLAGATGALGGKIGGAGVLGGLTGAVGGLVKGLAGGVAGALGGLARGAKGAAAGAAGALGGLAGAAVAGGVDSKSIVAGLNVQDPNVKLIVESMAILPDGTINVATTQASELNNKDAIKQTIAKTLQELDKKIENKMAFCDKNCFDDNLNTQNRKNCYHEGKVKNCFPCKAKQPPKTDNEKSIDKICSFMCNHVESTASCAFYGYINNNKKKIDLTPQTLFELGWKRTNPALKQK